MYEVDEIFPNLPCSTRLYLSQEVRDALVAYSDSEKKPGAFLKKLSYYAQAGFPHHEGKHGEPIKPEWDGVFRIASNDLFRVIGFYEDERKKAFIAIKTLKKHGQKLTGPERAIIDHVAEVKAKKLWKKKQHGEQFPRLANDS